MLITMNFKSEKSYLLFIILLSFFVQCKVAKNGFVNKDTIKPSLKDALSNPQFNVITLFTIRGATDKLPATSIALSYPQDIALDSIGNLYIVDWQHNRILREDAKTNRITLVAGNGMSGFAGDGGPATDAQILRPIGIALDKEGNIYITDQGNNRIRKIDARTGIIKTIAGSGKWHYDKGWTCGTDFSALNGIALDKDENVYVADVGDNCIKKVNQHTGKVTIVAGKPHIYKGSFVKSDSGDGGPATSALLSQPYAIAFDNSGDMYIADRANNKVRVVNRKTGKISSLNQPLVFPTDVKFDSRNNLYVSEEDGHCILKIDLKTGNRTEVVGGHYPSGDPYYGTYMYKPEGIAINANGDVYFAYSERHLIYRVEASTGKVDTVAGHGYPDFECDTLNNYFVNTYKQYKALDNEGNLYVPDRFHHGILRMDFATGKVSIIKGFDLPVAVAIDKNDNIYVSDKGTHRIDKINHGTGIITHICGGGEGGIALDDSNNIYIADGKSLLSKFSSTTGLLTTIAGTTDYKQQYVDGDGKPATSAWLASPGSVALDKKGNIYVAEIYSGIVRKIDARTKIISTVCGVKAKGYSSYGNKGIGYNGDGGPADSAKIEYVSNLTTDSAGNIYIVSYPGNPQLASHIRRIDAKTDTISTVAGNELIPVTQDNLATTGRQAIATDTAGYVYLVANHDKANGKNKQFYSVPCYPFIPYTDSTGYLGIRDTRYNTAYTLDAFTTPYYFSGLEDIAIGKGGCVYVATTNEVFKIDITTGKFLLVAGNGVTESFEGLSATDAHFNFDISGITADEIGNVYISVIPNNNVNNLDLNLKFKIYKVDGKTGIITTLAGNGKEGYSGDGGPAPLAELNAPCYAVADSAGNVYVTDSKDWRIRKIDAKTNIISTIAGNGIKGDSGDGGRALYAKLDELDNKMAIDPKGNIYIGGDKKIRRIDTHTGIINTVFRKDSALPVDNLTSIMYKLMGSVFQVDRRGMIYANGAACVYKIDTATKKVTVIAGGNSYDCDGCDATMENLYSIRKCVADKDGNIYVIYNASGYQAVGGNIKKIDSKNNKAYIYAGYGMKNKPPCNNSLPVEMTGPEDVLSDPLHKHVFLLYLMKATLYR